MRTVNTLVFCVVGLGSMASTLAFDSILLKNGKRLTGTIVAQSKDQVVMEVGDGVAVYSKRAIRRIYDDVTHNPPVVDVMADGALPPWWVPFADLYAEDWVTVVKRIPATPITHGKFQNVPYVSFRANERFELNIYGNLDSPAAIEIGIYGRKTPRDADVGRCREFLVSYLTTLPQIKALYSLDQRGGSEEVDGLTIQVTPPDAPEAYNGWWTLIYSPGKIAAAREPNRAAFEAASARNAALVTKSAGGQNTWRKWQLTDVVKRLIPLEQMEER